MGYDFKINKWYRIKHKEKKYPWPCKSQRGRTITLYDDDVLTKSEDGTFMKHTGLGCFNIEIPEEDLIEQCKAAKLRML